MHRTLGATLLLGLLGPAVLARQVPSPPGPSTFSPAVAQRRDVRAALAYVDQHFDEQVAEWIHLTEIPALSTHEQQRAAYIRAELEKADLHPTSDDIGNVMARRAGTGHGSPRSSDGRQTPSWAPVMDLSEIPDGAFVRHQWEVARARFFARTTRRYGVADTPIDVLDVGAGDGYFARRPGVPPRASRSCRSR